MNKLNKKMALFLGGLVLIVAVGVWGWLGSHNPIGVSTAAEMPTLNDHANTTSLDLTDSQLQSVKVEPVIRHAFSDEREAVGNIAFNDEKTVQVFSPYAGRIINVFAKAGDEVKKGAVLFTMNSPDLVQAESALISAAGVKALTSSALERARQLMEIQGIAQKDYQQAISDQQAAEGAYNAARNALRIFDLSDTEIDRIISTRKIDSAMPVTSPIGGRVTARNAAVGLLVQPGNAPAPFAVSDISSMWMMANVAESDIPQIRLGQDIEVGVMAFPGRIFHAKITNIGASVDPNTHRVQVRSEIKDVAHELRAGMFATFKIHLGDAVQFAAVPFDSVTRESDGSMSVWVTTDRHRFSKRTIRPGMQQDGLFQILEGLNPGELVATEGAIFLSNTLTTEIH